MRVIDAHVHLTADAPDSLATLDRLNVKLLNNIAILSREQPWRTADWLSVPEYRGLAQAHPHQAAWITSFALPRFDDPHYVEQVLAELDEDFAAGAVGCKGWKNIGMDLRRPDGSFMQIDDPLLTPIFAQLERLGRTLLLHIGEPRACWRPLDPSSPHYGYYRTHPQWHMYGKPGFPSHEEIIAARDRVVARHPKLRVVGAHLGSVEWDVAEIAARCARFPNFAVDCSARLGDLALQDPAHVRAFIEHYPDRLLFGTDHGAKVAHSRMAPAARAADLDNYARHIEDYRRYFADTGEVVICGQCRPCLGLPAALLERVFARNACAWFPGLTAD